MKKSIITAVIGIMAAGVAQSNAQTNTNTAGFWDQNVTFTLVSQSSGGHAALSTKVLIADLIGASVTNAGSGGVTTNLGVSANVTNSPVLALASGDYTNAATVSNLVTVTFTNGQSTNVSVVSTRTTNSPPTFTFSNTAVSSTNGETLRVLTNAPTLPVGTLTAVLVTTNGPGTVFAVSSPTTTTTNGPVVTVTNTSFAKTARLVARQPSPSGGNLTNPDQFLIVEGVGKKAVIVADVTPFFQETFGTLVDSITPNKHYLDFTLTYTGKTITFDTRGFATIITGTAKGASERKTFSSTLVGAGVGNGSPIVVSGKFNMTGGTLDTQ